MKKISGLLILFISAFGALPAQQGGTVIPACTGPYLGQKPPGEKSTVFVPGFISTEYGELNSVFTSDGGEFYFSRRGVPGKPSMIMVSKKVNNEWTRPQPVGFTGKYNDVDLFIAPGGGSMNFCSTRPHRMGDAEKKEHDFWMSKREGGQWTEPVLFASEALSDYEDFFPVVTNTGNLYFNPQRGGQKGNDIFCSKFTYGHYSVAERLPEPINSKYWEFDAYVTPDENISPDGKYLFYTSNKSGSDDIYWVSAKIIGELQQRRPQVAEKISEITYVANEGFLVETKQGKILVDALFGNIKGEWCDQPGDSVIKLMINGKSPFDNIDVVLVTHRHSDHFNAQMTIDYLQNNSNAVLVCPGQVNELLTRMEGYSKVSGQIIPIMSGDHPDTNVIIKGLSVRAMRLKHGSWFETDSATGRQVDLHAGIENLGYLIESEGFSVLHTGDCSTADNAQIASYKLASKEIDVVFLDRVFLGPEGMNIIHSELHSKNYVLMHVEPHKREYYKSVLKDAPDFFVFSNRMEKKEVAK